MPGEKVIRHALYAGEGTMNNIVRVNFSESDLTYPQKAETVTCSKCPGILPLTIVRDGGNIRGMYKTEGFVRLASLSNISAAMILTIAERAMECTEMCRDWLLFPEQYVFSADTVYISEDFRTVKLAYIPARKKYSENSSIAAFIYSLKALTTENGRTYLDTLGSMMECRNLKMSRVTGFIEQLKQEINLCGIE